MTTFRVILNEIKTLIEKGNGATEVELKQLWNELSNAITETEQLNKPAVSNHVCRTCKGTGLVYIDDVIKNTLCPDC